MAQRYERWLKAFLQINGLIMALAAVALFMPTSWMAWTHERVGLGEFPAAPIAEYLARLTSALHTVLGLLLLLLARDVRQYSRLITYLAIATPAVSISVAMMCLHLRMPLSWMISDPIASGLFCIVALALLRQIKKQEPPSGPR
jgi:hypothetical protein